MIEAYKIGVTLALHNQVSGALGIISREFVVADQKAQALKKTLGQIKLLTITGAAAVGVGFLGLRSLKEPLDEAKKFEQQLGKFSLFGLGDKVNKEAAAYARGMDIMGSSATENMRLMVEAQGIFRESGLSGSAALEGAKLAAPMLAKINFATEGLDDESKAKMRNQSMAMLRFVEMRGGLKSPEAFNSIADAGWKAIQSSGGNVNWEQMRQFMARGGVAAQGLSDTTLFGKLEPIIGELKGSTAGNAWMTAYNRLVGGVKVPNQVAHLLAEKGIWDEKKIEWNSMGGIAKFKGNPLIDMATFGTDPAAFYEMNILPMYAKMNNGKGLDATERGRENTLIFGRTGGAMFSLIDRQLAVMERSVAAQAKMLGVDDSVVTASKTLSGREVDLEAKWHGLMLELGNAILPTVYSITLRVIDGLKGLTRWMREHEGMTKALVLAFAGFSTLALAGGGLLLFTAALRGFLVFVPMLSIVTRALSGALVLPGLITPAATMIGAALARIGAVFGIGSGPVGWIILGITAAIAAAAYAYTHWDTVKPKLMAVWHQVGEWFDKLGQAVVEGMSRLWDWLKKLPSDVWTGAKALPGELVEGGKKLAGDFMSWAKNPPALKDALGMGTGQPFTPPPPANQKITVENTINLDGRTVAKNTADHFYDMMNSPASALGGFDGRKSFTPSALASSP
jgi:hypothetical protein